MGTADGGGENPTGAPVIVCGLGRFGLRVVQHLRRRDLPVVVITDANVRGDRLALARTLGARVVIGDFRFATVREEAGITDCRAVILATSDDDANLEAALDVRSETPQIRLVMRRSDHNIAARLERDFGFAAVLAPPSLAAPTFIQAALAPPNAPPTEVATAVAARPRGRRRLRLHLPHVLGMILVGLFVAGVMIFARALHVSTLDAAYFTVTILTTVGFGDFNLQDESAPVKLFGMLLMLSGVILIAVMSSLLTNFLISGAIVELRSANQARRLQDHIIVCGLGTVGLAIAQGLRDAGHPVLGIDTEPLPDLVRLNIANSMADFPVLTGDAASVDVLNRAGIGRARALVAAVSSDAINLEIGLTAQTVVEQTRPDRPLRLVLRCFDADLSRRIHQISNNYTVLSSAEIAAPIVIDAALGEER